MQGKLQTIPTDKTYGIAIKEYLSPHGTVYLVKERQLTGTTYGGYGIALDMSEIIYRYLSGSEGSRDMHLNTNIQPNDADYFLDEYLAEIGLKFAQEKMHGYIYGVTG